MIWASGTISTDRNVTHSNFRKLSLSGKTKYMQTLWSSNSTLTHTYLKDMFAHAYQDSQLKMLIAMLLIPTFRKTLNAHHK